MLLLRQLEVLRFTLGYQAKLKACNFFNCRIYKKEVFWTMGAGQKSKNPHHGFSTAVKITGTHFLNRT